MKLKNEEACRRAGLTEEQTKRIRQIYDTSYKRMKREKEYREKNNIVFNSMSALVSDVDGCIEYEIPDMSNEPLQMLIGKEDERELVVKLDVLRESLKELEADEQELLLAYYSGSYGIESQLARELGMDRKKFIRTREKILKKLQGIYFGKYRDMD